MDVRVIPVSIFGICPQIIIDRKQFSGRRASNGDAGWLYLDLPALTQRGRVSWYTTVTVHSRSLFAIFPSVHVFVSSDIRCICATLCGPDKYRPCGRLNFFEERQSSEETCLWYANASPTSAQGLALSRTSAYSRKPVPRAPV